MRAARLPIAILILFISVSAIHSQDASPGAQTSLTNTEIVQMVKSGLSSELIIAKIKASKTSFDTAPSVLAELKQNGVAETILVAMVEAGAPPKAKSSLPPQPDQNLELARSALKALRKIVSAVEVGIVYTNYSPLVAEAKADVEDSLLRMKDGDLKANIKASLDEYTYAAYVWQATWRDDFISGPLRETAVTKYGVKRKGLFKVVWRDDFLSAIWRGARNHFEIANTVLTQAQTVSTADSKSLTLRDDLIGAWKIVMSNDGNTLEYHLVIVQSTDGYRGTLRSPMGNADNLPITRNGNNFALIASEQVKKRTMSMQFEGTFEADSMKGSATLNDGKISATVPFTGTRLLN